ncbi:hypothetical protein ACN47E_001933 [Coniothyrium glycines]
MGLLLARYPHPKKEVFSLLPKSMYPPPTTTTCNIRAEDGANNASATPSMSCISQAKNPQPKNITIPHFPKAIFQQGSQPASQSIYDLWAEQALRQEDRRRSFKLSVCTLFEPDKRDVY